MEFARVERHVVKARVELALPPQGRPTACSLENTDIAEVHHGGQTVCFCSTVKVVVEIFQGRFIWAIKTEVAVLSAGKNWVVQESGRVGAID